MRIAFLCKRRYMSKDVIVDRYARLYEIPYQVARLGHEVRGYCLSYQEAEQGTWKHDAAPGSLDWHSCDLGKLKLPVLLGYPLAMLRAMKQFQPDIIIAASDIPHVVLGGWLAKRLGIPFVADLYDNFEGFGQARILGFVPALRRAVRHADLVLTTSEPLRQKVEAEYQAKGYVLAMPSTVDTEVFRWQDKLDCRAMLGLPEDAVLIGTAGGLMENRGVGDIYQAWDLIQYKHPNVHLVLAGPTDDSLLPPQHERVHFLGMLSHGDTAKLFAALDVGIIYLRDTPFGRYCFPQKAYEMQACGLPVVAANVGVMPHILCELSAAIYEPGNPDDLIRAIEYQISERLLPSEAVHSWEVVISKLEKQLLSL